MAEFYTYQRKRKDFGKPCQFADSEIKHCGFFPTQNVQFEYLKRNPNFIDLDNIAEYSEHQVNTERISTGDKGMYHKEGGWPSGVDPTEPQETAKYKKKIEKDPTFGVAVKELSGTIEKCISQNNQIDLFEEYFQDEKSEHQVENLSTKTLMLFKDKCEVAKRSVSEISWHPEGPTKAAVSYAIFRFQQMPDGMHNSAYVWDLNNPNKADVELGISSPVTNLMYNPKLVDQIGGGCYNGLVAVWDVRKGNQPTLMSPVEKSHHDPVTHFQWLFSKTGTECVTTSTDGRALWWDTRKFSDGPIEVLNITEGFGQEAKEEIIGATVLEYSLEAGPTKYLLGTEAGSILIANKKPKKNVEITSRYGLESGRHLGPVYAINRSIPAPKYFLSVGDWSAKIWVEDLKTPIMRTKYHDSYLTDGCWSPTRNGVFFLIRKDGWMDNEIAFSHKVSDTSLTCIKINSAPQQNPNNGKLVAIGDQDGTVTLLELCDSLYHVQYKEKEIITEMFEREARKEKNLEAIKKQQELQKKTVVKENTAAKEKWDQRKKELISEVEVKFQALKKVEEEERIKNEGAELDSPRERKQDDQKKNKDQQNDDDQGNDKQQDGDGQGDQQNQGDDTQKQDDGQDGQDKQDGQDGQDKQDDQDGQKDDSGQKGGDQSQDQKQGDQKKKEQQQQSQDQSGQQSNDQQQQDNQANQDDQNNQPQDQPQDDQQGNGDQPQNE